MHDLSDFRREWVGGYYEGDPTDPFGASGYLAVGYVSVLYVTYLMCIKPHIDADTTVLEIGPGRGAWTKAMLDLGPKAIYALDAADADHSGFANYVGRSSRVHHQQVSDETLDGVPDGEVGFFFSFGVFCHLPESIVGNYLRSLLPKMRSGAHGYFMVADFKQHDKILGGPDVLDQLLAKRRYVAQRGVHKAMRRLFPNVTRGRLRAEYHPKGASEWYDIGKDRSVELVEAAGFQVVERDVGTCPRDPVIHFVKP